MTKELDIVLSAYRSFRSPIAYVSMPLTTGRRLYDLLQERGLKDMRHVERSELVSQVIEPNIAEGIQFAEKLRKREFPPVAPAVFKARDWSQDEYMSLWLQLITEKAREIHMSPNWGFSNGCVEEFVRAMEMQYGFINTSWGMERFPSDADKSKEYLSVRQIRAYDSEERELKLDSGALIVVDAIKDLRKRGFDSTKLFAGLQKLINIGGYFNDSSTSSKECFEMLDGTANFDWGSMLKGFKSLN